MTNWDIYNRVNYIINKEQSGNTFNTSEFTEVLNAKSFELQRKLLGLPEQYQLVPTTTLGFGKTTHINDALRPFIISNKAVTLSLGKGSLPTDYYYHISTTFDYIISNTCLDTTLEEVEVELCNLGAFKTRSKGWYVQATLDAPIMTFYDTSVEVFPKSIKAVKMSYFKLPRKAVVVTTIDPTSLAEIYDPINSVELEWGEQEQLEIVRMILADVGINLKSADILQASQNV